MREGDEQEVIDCLHSTQRALMDCEIKVVLEADGLLFKIRIDGETVIEVRYPDDIIDYQYVSEDSLAISLSITVKQVREHLRSA